jgi:hypothetical protein
MTNSKPRKFISEDNVMSGEILERPKPKEQATTFGSVPKNAKLVCNWPT